jgi:hypothetical protein
MVDVACPKDAQDTPGHSFIPHNRGIVLNKGSVDQWISIKTGSGEPILSLKKVYDTSNGDLTCVIGQVLQ